MNTDQIDNIIIKLAELSNQPYNYLDLKDKYAEDVVYTSQEIDKFIDKLMEKGQKLHLTLLKNHVPKENLIELLELATFPVLLFAKNDQNEIIPIVEHNKSGKKTIFIDMLADRVLGVEESENMLQNLMTYQDAPNPQLNDEVIFITAFPFEYITKDYYRQAEGGELKLNPVQRLFRLLRSESKEIGYIYVYAFVVGLISLSLPLGIQATISLISGGLIFSSVIVLIALVILGILVAGGLQVMQITLVEILQQRLFAKAAFEIAFRVTKIRAESLIKIHPPELMNRFFDVVTIQKGLPKIFVDITGAVIQIVFGLLLLSLYHPFFLIFSIVLISSVTIVFYWTGPPGLKTAILESKYKYKVVYWLEELARTTNAFKQAGTTNLPIQKMDELVNNYLYYRKAHFRILLTQFFNIVAFKTIVTGGLLIIGTALVVDRQITLGQFVASEVIIILVVGSVEKLILSLDVIYDVLTAVDKIAAITDLKIEQNEGLNFSLRNNPKGLHLQAKGLKYRYADNSNYTLKGLDFEIEAGESVCVAGANDAGKNTLVKVLIGILTEYEGVLTMNNLSLRDISLNSVRDAVNKNLSQDEIFDGTILDNITMGRASVKYTDVVWAIDNLGLADYLASLPEGLHTHIGNTGKNLSHSIIIKILLARSVASKPKLLIINDFSEHLVKNEKLKILSFLQEKSNGWTLMILSLNDDPLLLSSCDKILLMNKGEIVAKGSYEQLLSDKNFQSLIFKKR